MNITKSIDDIKNEVCDKISAVDIKDVSLDNVSIRIGGVVYGLNKVSNDNIDIDSEIREEYREKLTKVLSDLKKVVIEKMDQSKRLIDTIKSDYEKMSNVLRNDYELKEIELQRKIQQSAPMPDIRREHAIKGLSVAKGDRPGEIIWLVRRTYWPKYIDRKPINATYIKKMITPIIIYIVTRDNYVTGVSTRQIGNLNYFSHYHQSSPDCWGNWVPPSTWNTADDILNIADQAVYVLENINSASLATRSPRGLPRFGTLMRNLVSDGSGVVSDNPRNSLDRTGVNRESEINNSDVWSSV
jgi:hypothetical protein